MYAATRLGSLAILAVSCGPTRVSEPASPNAAGMTPPVRDALREAVAGPQRSEKKRARDTYRHPVETLELFGVRGDMYGPSRRVWALPPTYANGATDHARYEATGASDRMILRFVKP